MIYETNIVFCIHSELLLGSSKKQKLINRRQSVERQREFSSLLVEPSSRRAQESGLKKLTLIAVIHHLSDVNFSLFSKVI